MPLNDNEYYMGDKTLPTGNIKQEYTPEMIKEVFSCANNIQKFVKHFWITTLDHGKEKINLYRPQKRLLKALTNYRFNIFLASRQIGKTTVTIIYALWVVCFQKDKTILIVANKEDTAKEILLRIKTAYQQLPNWLKPGVTEWAKTGVAFSNDSRILISTTSSSAARGLSINILIIDEMAAIPEYIIEEFWNSVIPVISSSRSTKVFVVSTPNGAGNLFHKIYTGAERGDPKFAEWHHERVDWWEIPGRGKKWESEQRALLAGQDKSFDQEFGCCATGDTTITVKNKETNEISTITYNKLWEILD